jgi:hypothetical protein
LEEKKPLKPDFYSFEKKWTEQTNNYNKKPTQKPIEVSQNMYRLYFAEINIQTNNYLENKGK